MSGSNPSDIENQVAAWRGDEAAFLEATGRPASAFAKRRPDQEAEDFSRWQQTRLLESILEELRAQNAQLKAERVRAAKERAIGQLTGSGSRTKKILNEEWYE